MAVPALDEHLPELADFIQQLAREYQQGQLTDWQQFVEKVRQFYDVATMAKIERRAPGWSAMAAQANQQTLIHVTSVFTALVLLPEYQSAPDDQRRLMQWMVLFHDIAKVVVPGNHDYIHAFRSAAVAGKALAGLGFPATEHYSQQVNRWHDFTWNAVRDDVPSGETIQDNTQLPPIIAGINALYGERSKASLVIEAILFHLSLVTDPDYPILAPLSSDEIAIYLTADLYPLLKAMLLVDTDGWNLFDPSEKQRQRQQTLAAFDRITELIHYSES